MIQLTRFHLIWYRYLP